MSVAALRYITVPRLPRRTGTRDVRMVGMDELLGEERRGPSDTVIPCSRQCLTDPAMHGSAG